MGTSRPLFLYVLHPGLFSQYGDTTHSFLFTLPPTPIWLHNYHVINTALPKIANNFHDGKSNGYFSAHVSLDLLAIYVTIPFFLKNCPLLAFMNAHQLFNSSFYPVPVTEFPDTGKVLWGITPPPHSGPVVWEGSQLQGKVQTGLRQWLHCISWVWYLVQG